MSGHKRAVSESLKKKVAYEQEYKCAICACILPPSYQVDHILPHSIGKDDTRENLQALCPSCHTQKTQQEHRRILVFKKLTKSVPSDKVLCYFCLVAYPGHLEHKCSRICVDIDKFLHIQQTTCDSFEKICDKYSYIPFYFNVDSLSLEFNKKMSLETETEQSQSIRPHSVLYIEINEGFLWVNNYFTRIVDNNITPNDIADAVKIATRFKSDFERYDKVEVVLNLAHLCNDSSESDNCIDYLDEHLDESMPRRIFKRNVAPTYEYSVR